MHEHEGNHQEQVGEVIKQTGASIDDLALKMLFVTIQQINLEVCIEYAVNNSVLHSFIVASTYDMTWLGDTIIWSKPGFSGGKNEKEGINLRGSCKWRGVSIPCTLVEYLFHQPRMTAFVPITCSHNVRTEFETKDDSSIYIIAQDVARVMANQSWKTSALHPRSWNN